MEQTGKMLNYYQIYHLDRNEDRKALKAKLQKEQGKIKAMMVSGSSNKDYMEKLTMLDIQIMNAIKVFKNDINREAYDRELDAAFEAGRVDISLQNEIQSLLDEIRQLYEAYQFTQVITKCYEAIDSGVHDSEVYGFMAQSYEQLGRTVDAVNAADEGVTKNPENPFSISLCCRMTCNYGNDMGKVERMIARLRLLDPKGGLAVIEEAYMNIRSKMFDRAFSLYESYINANPTDQTFRQNAAYDLIGQAASLYVNDPSGISEVKALTSEEDYNLCLALAEEAARLCNNPTVHQFLEATREFGIVENNPEFDNAKLANKGMMGFLLFGCIATVVGTLAAFIISGWSLYVFIPGFYSLAVFGGCYLVRKKRFQKIEDAAKRPRWAYYKYEFYGEMELNEAEAKGLINQEKEMVKTGFRVAIDLIKILFRSGLFS